MNELTEQLTRKARGLLQSAQQLEDANGPEDTVRALRRKAMSVDGAV